MTPPLAPPAPPAPHPAEQHYHLGAWGSRYFFVNEKGHVGVRPQGEGGAAIDLFEIVETLRGRGVQTPLLVRFQDLLHTRVQRLHEAFRRAIEAAGYRGRYQGVFPVKVNQLREVVEEVVEAGEAFGYGLECGSKAELVATLPYLSHPDMPLVCNGYKDGDMMRLMLAGQRLGRNVIPVIEREEEFALLRRLRPDDTPGPSGFGVRVRLSTNGAGLWAESGGEGSKFGLSLAELMRLVDETRAAGDALAFRLLHFHLGSQLASVHNVSQAAYEGARVYAWLRHQGLPVEMVDVGGGLGVTYEAGNPDVRGSIDYTLGQYATAIVEAIGRVCDEEGVPHPTILSESGRAVAAYHSVLVVEVLDRREKGLPPSRPFDQHHPLFDALDRLEARIREAPDVAAFPEEIETLREEATALFRGARLGLEGKAHVEHRLWTLLRLVQARGADGGVDKQVADHYLCDFSVFRSMVDHWAIGQRFPILPIHRLDEPPTHRGTLVDLTCDSDGKVASFISPTGSKHALELHDLRPGEPYYLGVFLMGAYQDIMGDMHNLFGRVTEAHVYLDDEEDQHFYVEQILPGQTVESILALVQYFPNDLVRRMDKLVRQEVRRGRIRAKEGVELLGLYRAAFQAYTYADIEGA